MTQFHQARPDNDGNWHSDTFQADDKIRAGRLGLKRHVQSSLLFDRSEC